MAALLGPLVGSGPKHILTSDCEIYLTEIVLICGHNEGLSYLCGRGCWFGQMLIFYGDSSEKSNPRAVTSIHTF